MRPLIVTVLLLAGSTVWADNHANTGSIAETFRCTFNDGQDADDLRAATDYFSKQMDKIGSDDLNDYFAAILTPLRASMDGDYGWIGYWPNLNAMARGLDAFYGSSEGQAANDRLNNVGTCQANTWVRTPLVTNFPDEDNATPEADAVELHVCSLRDGATLDSLGAAEQGFLDANAGEPIAVDRWTPLFAATEADAIYLIAHENLEKFAGFNSRWRTSEAGQNNLAHFNSIMNCESGIYTGRVIRQGTVE